MASLPRYILLWLSVAAVCTFATEDNSEVALDLVFTQEPQDVIVLRGEPFVFDCSAISVHDGNRPANITWRRDGYIINDARRYVLSNGSLFFDRLVRKKHGRGDEGFYECLARNSGGTIVSRRARLTIAAIERLEGGGTVAAVEGELVRLPCNLKAVPAPTVTWQKDKTDLPKHSRYTLLSSGVLQIEGVIESDTGQYRCKVTNMAGSKFSREDELIIERPESPPGRKPPEMLLLPQHITMKKGETVTLECAASGLPMPTLAWTFPNGTAVSHARAEVVGHGNLRIHNLTAADSSQYVCTASNPDNPQQAVTVQTKLIVIEPPRVILSTPSMEKQRSDTVRIHCTFDGATTQVTRFKDGAYQPTKKDDWVIPFLVDANAGYYQCRAQNEAGQVITTMRLTIRSSDLTPDRPQNVRARISGPTSLFVQWDPVPPKKDVHVVGYSVHYCNVDEQLELQTLSLQPFAELNALTPYSNISIYVMAYNERQGGGPSDTIYVIMGEDIPTAAPAVTVEPAGASSLKVRWEKLPIAKARGAIIEYDIYYRESDKGSIKVESVPGDVYEYTLSGLDPNKAYAVRVMGRTNKGFPELTDEEWPWVTHYTNLQHDVLEPPSMQVYALNSSAVHVRWRPSNPGHQGIAGYRLDVLSIRNVLLKRLIFTPDRLQDTVTGLKPKTKYKVSLRCLGNVNQLQQEGEPTVSNVRTLKLGEPGVLPTAPPPPQKLDAFPLNVSAVRFLWHRPKFTPGISFYTIRFTPVRMDLTKAAANATFVKHIVTNDNETLEKLIGGLSAYTLYEFSVRTHTSHSFGAFSNPVRCRTEEGLPSAPHNVQYTLRGPGRVELTWEPPRQRNGVITQYVINYRAKKEPEPDWGAKLENGTSHMAEVEDLQLDQAYQFQLRARTSVGEGPPSATLVIHTQNPYPTPGQPNGPERVSIQEQRKGIIIGVTVAGICVIICVVLIILRNRCCRPQPAAAATRFGSGASPNSTLPLHFNGTYMPNANGNRYLANDTGMTMTGDTHTMETLTPMLPPLVENENSDSKGGYGGPGMQGLRVQCMPNGQVATFLTNQDSHNNKHQKTTCLMGNGRNSLPPGVVVGDGAPDISRNDPPLNMSPAPVATTPGLVQGPGGQQDGELEEDEEEEGSAPSQSSDSASTPSTADLPTSTPACPIPRPAGAGSGGDVVPPPLPYHSRNHPHQASTASTTTATRNASNNRMDCEEGDSDMDAAGECERLLGPQSPSNPTPKHPHSSPSSQHATSTTQPQPPTSRQPQPSPSQSTPHRSSLTEYASSPPQSRYAGDSSSRRQCPTDELLAASDGDTSGTPLLSGSPHHQDSVGGQFTPNGSSSHLHEAPSSDSSTHRA